MVDGLQYVFTEGQLRGQSNFYITLLSINTLMINRADRELKASVG